MAGTYIEAFFGADDSPVATSGDLVYKEVLREGEFRMTPTSEGIKPVPFRVVRDGSSSRKDRTISMAELVQSFRDKAYEHVQVPLAEKPNADHQDYARVNTGFVRDLQIREGEDGRARLVAGIHFTEPEVAEKCKRGTIANCSSGIFFDRIRPSDGKSFGSAMRHVALTNTPFVDNLKPFGIGMSEEDGTDQPDEVLSVEMAEREPVWGPNESFSRLQMNVTKAFQDLTAAQNPMGIDDPNAKILFPRDIWTTKALAEDMQSGEVVVVPFKRKKDSVELAPQGEWTRAEQEWVAASEDSPIRAASRSLAEEAIRSVREARAAQKPEPEAVEASEGKVDNSPQGRLRSAHGERKARLAGTHDKKNASGGATSMSGTTLDLSALELSDDQRNALQALLSENQTLKAERRREAVEAEVQRVMGLGLSENTGFVKLYRRLLLADDGEPAIVLSDESTGTDRGVSLTDALKSMIDALPRNAEGKIVLSDQALVSQAGTRPANESAEEREESLDDKLSDVLQRAGLTDWRS
jgi:hypothetical protein